MYIKRSDEKQSQVYDQTGRQQQLRRSLERQLRASQRLVPDRKSFSDF